MSRKREQAEMFVKLGELLGPLKKVAENPDAFDSDERMRILARFVFDSEKFQPAFYKFCRSEPGHIYDAQSNYVSIALRTFINQSHTEPDQVLARIPKLWDELFGILSSIPVSIESAIHAAQTPFSVYCLLQELCTTVQKRIVWLDRYFDHRVFHRFFAETPKSVEIVLVTWPESKCRSNYDRNRYGQFLDVSRLFSQERGVGGYRLLTNENIHARLLRCDDGFFNLGDSAKEVGTGVDFTVSKLNSTPENFSQIDSRLTSGVELFGPSQTTHL